MDPGCFGSLTRYDANTILFTNAADASSRANITVRASLDDGKTWPVSRSIDPEQGAYSDIAVDQDGVIYILYEKGTSIRLARFGMEWLNNANKARLKELTSSVGKISPDFAPQTLQYTLEVDEAVTELDLTHLPYVPGAKITVNDQPVSTDTTHLTLQSAKTVVTIVVQADDADDANTYTLTIQKLIPVGAESMVAYYDFDTLDSGIVPDGSGRENHLTVNGAASTPEGKYGGGVKFTNTTNYLELAGTNGLSFGTRDFTASVWLRPAAIDGQRFIFWYGTNTTNANQWWVRQNNGALQFLQSDGSESIVTTPTVLSNDTWTHAAFVKKGNLQQIYINGSLSVQTTTAKEYNVNGIDTLRIGLQKSGAVRPWKGDMDEIRLYNGTLSAEDIDKLFSEAPVQEYTITASAEAGGSIDPGGDVKAAKNTSQTFVITPDHGNKVADVVVNGNSVGAVTSYVFDPVTSDATIHATFIQDGSILEQLQALLAAAEHMTESDFTPESWDAFKQALEAAKAVASDSTATKEDVDAAAAALQAAIEALVAAAPPI